MSAHQHSSWLYEHMRAQMEEQRAAADQAIQRERRRADQAIQERDTLRRTVGELGAIREGRTGSSGPLHTLTVRRGSSGGSGGSGSGSGTRPPRTDGSGARRVRRRTDDSGSDYADDLGED